MNKMLNYIKNSITLFMDVAKKEAPLGKSKIGGRPHLPKNFKWPYYEGSNFDGETKNRPLSFIAQFNLEDVHNFDLEGVLPQHGFLYFFYELNTMKWGFDSKDIGSAKVIYKDVSESELCATDFPADLEQQYYLPELTIKFINQKSLPSYEEYTESFNSKISRDKFKQLTSVISSQDIEPYQQFKLLGYADVIQDSMLRQCEMVSRKIYCGGPTKIAKKQSKEIAKNAQDWILLAQFGEIAENVLFGDCGCIYYYIRKQDLQNKDFSKVLLCLQCS